MKKKLKKIPTFTTDEAAEHFVDTADLSEYDLSGFKKVHFEFLPKAKSVSLRLPERLYESTKRKAKKQGMKTQQFIRQALEKAVS